MYNQGTFERRRIHESKVDRAFEVTPSDSQDLKHPTIAIYVAEEGDLRIMLASEEVVTLQNLVAGAWHPISAIKIFQTGTTCSGIVGAY